MVCLGWMTHCAIGVDDVAVTSAFPLTAHIARLDEVGHDALCGALCDADALCDVAQPHVVLSGDAEQHLCVVGDEAPGLVAV